MDCVEAEGNWYMGNAKQCEYERTFWDTSAVFENNFMCSHHKFEILSQYF